MNWIQENWMAVGVIVLAAHELLKAIADVTKTKKDDAIVAKIGSVLKYLFLGKRPGA
jgi:hypothetical protein